MILKRLAVESFGCFAEPFEVSFAPGLTVIRGPNEAGKSTLRQALQMALFQKATSTADAVKALATWGAERGFVLELDYENDGQHFVLRKDFGSRRATLRRNGEILSENSDRVQELLDEHLAPLNDEKVFSSVTCVEQGALARLVEAGGRSGKALEQAIETAVTGGAERQRLAEIISQLEREIQRLGVGFSEDPDKARPYKIPGPVRAAQETVERLESELAKANEEAEQVALAREEEAEAEGKLADLTAEREAATRLYQACTEAERLKRQADEARKAEDDCRKRLDHIRELDAALSQLRSKREGLQRASALTPEVLGEIAKDLAQAERLEHTAQEEQPSHEQRARRLRTLEEEISRLEQGKAEVAGGAALTDETLRELETLEKGVGNLDEQVEELERARTLVRSPVQAVLLTLALAFALAGVVLFVAGRPQLGIYCWAAAGALSGVALRAHLAYRAQARALDEELARVSNQLASARSRFESRLAELAVGSLAEARDLRARYDKWRAEIDKLEAERSGLRQSWPEKPPETRLEDAAALRQKAQSRLAELGYASLEEAQEARRQFDELEQEIAQLEAQRDGTLMGETTETLEAVMADHARKRRDAEARLSEDPLLQKAQAMTAEEVARLTRQIEQLERDIARHTERRASARATRERFGDAPDKAASLEAQLEQAKRLFEANKHAYDVRVALRDILKPVAAQFDARWKPRVAARVGDLLSHITRGRYCSIETARGVDFTLHLPGSGQPVRPAQLSHSTREQLYLAARIALLEEMCAGKQFPLILDDPFVSFDGERRAAAAAMCRQLAEGRQVVLLTCSEEYDGLADQVNVLPPPR